MLEPVDVLELYKATGAYLEGHFLLASGQHSAKFLQSTTVMQFPQHAEAFGRAIAALFSEKPDFVIGPAMGGIVLAHETAKALGCRALFAEKELGGTMAIRSAFSIRAEERFIVVEDVMTTGGSLKKTIVAAEKAGARCVGIGCIIDRGLADLGDYPHPRALVKLEFPTYSPADCPLCRAGIPLEKV